MTSKRDCGEERTGYEIAIRGPEKTSFRDSHGKLVHDVSPFDASLCS